MASSTSSSRGRGRGRGFWMQLKLNDDGTTNSQQPSSSKSGLATIISEKVIAPTSTTALPVATDFKVDALIAQHKTRPALIKIVNIDLSRQLLDVTFRGHDCVFKCRAGVQESKLFKKWKTENQFLFSSNNGLMEKSLMSALELLDTKDIAVSHVEKDEEGFLRLKFDVQGSPVLRNNFITSVLFHSVPRMPAPGMKKIAWITNVRQNMEIDVVFDNDLWFKVRKEIHDIQVRKQLYSPQCAVKTKFFLEMVKDYGAPYFLAPMKDDWGELYRVKVLEVETDTEVKVQYLDIGLEACIPVRNLTAPLRADFIPELLECLPPLAVTVQLKNSSQNKSCFWNSMKSLLELRPCYLKVVDEIPKVENGKLGDVPLVVEVFVLTVDNQRIRSVNDIIDYELRGSSKLPFEDLGEISLEPLTKLLKKFEASNRERQGKEKLYSALHACTDAKGQSQVSTIRMPTCQCCSEESSGRTIVSSSVNALVA